MEFSTGLLRTKDNDASAVNAAICLQKANNAVNNCGYSRTDTMTGLCITVQSSKPKLGKYIPGYYFLFDCNFQLYTSPMYIDHLNWSNSHEQLV